MSRSCPICERQPLVPFAIQGVGIETCQTCGGLWFGPGKLERFAERASPHELLPLARHAPGRCRRGGHAVSQAMVCCAVCGGAPASCPSCQLRLAMVSTPVCVIDICASCHGIWLDAGELEMLKRAGPPTASPPPAPSSVRGKWEIPAASTPAKDPWLAPGQVQAPQRVSAIPDARTAFNCRQCGTALALAQAWAYDGEIYCAGCHPPGAVSSSELPSDHSAKDEPVRAGRGLFDLLLTLLSS